MADSRSDRERGARVGKISAETFLAAIEPYLGAPSPRILVRAQLGHDSGVVDLGGGQVLVVTEDPNFAIRGLPLEYLGASAIHIAGSDVAVMGIAPQFVTWTLLLPVGFADADLARIQRGADAAARDLGIAILGGHTGYYPQLVEPIVGGITAFGIGAKSQFITPGGCRVGDHIVVTKGPGLECAVLLAKLCADALATRVPPELLARADGLLASLSVVRDAAIAVAVGEVHAMHDATEGGLMQALHEIAEASHVGLQLEEARLPMDPLASAVADALGYDPLDALSEGTLVASVAPGRSDVLVAALRAEGIAAASIGTVVDLALGRTIRHRDGRAQPIGAVERDPFYDHYAALT